MIAAIALLGEAIVISLSREAMLGCVAIANHPTDKTAQPRIVRPEQRIERRGVAHESPSCGLPSRRAPNTRRIGVGNHEAEGGHRMCTRE